MSAISGRIRTKLLDSSEMLGGVALNAAEGTRTMTITGLGGSWSKLRLRVQYTYSAATSVTLTPTVKHHLDTGFASMVTTSYSSGVGTVSAQTRVVTGTADFDYEFEFDVRGLDEFKVVFLGGGTPGAGDLITTSGILSAGE